ncbi:MAG: hypothetical protein ACR2NB_12355 [Solirubrobacteraceae bacterium]
MSAATGGFPGDDLIADPLIVVDRHATFAAPPAAVWPWLLQVGKGRAGWYLPGWLEAVVPRARRGARAIDPSLQDVVPGTETGDWGPGEPAFRAVTVDAQRALVWLSLRDPARGHRWPADDLPPWAPEVLAFSWALLVLEDAAGGTHLHIRLRMDKGAWRTSPRFRIMRPAFDFFDWLTIVGLFAGLRERLAAVR